MNVPVLPALRPDTPRAPRQGPARDALRLREAYCLTCPWTTRAGLGDAALLNRANTHTDRTGHETRAW